jgi:hypothetical protein
MPPEETTTKAVPKLDLKLEVDANMVQLADLSIKTLQQLKTQIFLLIYS